MRYYLLTPRRGVGSSYLSIFAVSRPARPGPAGHFQNRKQSCDLNGWILGYLASLEMATFWRQNRIEVPRFVALLLAVSEVSGFRTFEISHFWRFFVTFWIHSLIVRPRFARRLWDRFSAISEAGDLRICNISHFWRFFVTLLSHSPIVRPRFRLRMVCFSIRYMSPPQNQDRWTDTHPGGHLRV